MLITSRRLAAFAAALLLAVLLVAILASHQGRVEWRTEHDGAITGNAGPGSIWTTVSDSVDPTKLPLRDKQYGTSPKVGYVYTCNGKKFYETLPFGARHTGSWVSGSTYDMTKKITVQGNVYWPDAAFAVGVSGSSRTFVGNGLPVGTPTGIFPVSRSDPAYRYDPNPNRISPQAISTSVPTNPTIAAQPSCVGLRVGISLDGVIISQPLDSRGRNELAHEIQDSCNGVAEPGNIYHRHSLSACMPHIREKNALVGYALDGFGIFSPYDADGRELTTSDLDECHGTTKPIMWDGEMREMYHYVMTRDFPFTIGCFRGTPVMSLPLPPRPPLIHRILGFLRSRL